jgi:hypothetical protein
LQSYGFGGNWELEEKNIGKWFAINTKSHTPNRLLKEPTASLFRVKWSKHLSKRAVITTRNHTLPRKTNFHRRKISELASEYFMKICNFVS